MTARWPVVVHCARPECGRLETEHKIRTDGRSRGGTDDGVCPGWQPGRREERPPEGELRRRLAAVVDLAAAPPAPGGLADHPERLAWWRAGWAAARTAAILAATGEDPTP